MYIWTILHVRQAFQQLAHEWVRSMWYSALEPPWPSTLHQSPSTTKKGEQQAIKLDDSMLAIKWVHKRVITALTTIHDDSKVAAERRSRNATGGPEIVQKPLAIVEYNKYMGGVDHTDQLLSYYGPSYGQMMEAGLLSVGHGSGE